MPRDREPFAEQPGRMVRGAPPGNRSRRTADIPDPDRPPLSREQLKIARWLKKLKFHKKLFGGIPEQEVWKRMGELNALYEAALTAERARCDALIEQARAEAGRGEAVFPGRRAEHE